MISTYPGLVMPSTLGVPDGKDMEDITPESEHKFCTCSSQPPDLREDAVPELPSPLSAVAGTKACGTHE